MNRTEKPATTTMKEVAQEAGVSIAAVSKVLHGKGPNIRVSEARAEVIREAAKKLRYQPNGLARSLRMSRTHTVGLIWENMADIGDGPLYYMYLLDGVASELFRKHYRLTILPEIPHSSTISSLSDGRLDGVIWCKMPDLPGIRDQLTHSSLNVVGLNTQAAHSLCPMVTCDNEHGSGLVVDHLVDLGHRNIAFAQDWGSEDTPDAITRYDGYRKALQKHGIPFSENLLFWCDKHKPEVADWLNRNPETTAVYAWYEGLAGKIMASAQEAGYQIPRDLSVVGFDSTLYCDTLSPKLTAIRQPIKEMAQVAARALMDLIEGQVPDKTSYIFPCTLDVRESSSHPAPSRAPESQRRGNLL